MGVYPGWGIAGGCREGYTGYPPGTVPGPVFNTILRLRPYPRPNEGNLRLIDEVSEIRVQIDLRMDPE